MFFDLETVLRMFAESFYTHLVVVEPPFSGLEHFDPGIRKMLEPDFDFQAFGQALLEMVPENTIVLTRDEFNCSYGVLRIPGSEDKVYIIGASVRAPMKHETQEQILRQYGNEKFRQFMRIYQSLPVEYESGGRNYLNTLFSSVFSGIELKDVVIPHYFPMPLLHTFTDSDTPREAVLSDYILMQDWNSLELQLMSCIASGDVEQAFSVLRQKERVSLPESITDSDQSIRQQAFMINAVCQYVVNAAQQVHPWYTFEIYKMFDTKIGAVSNQRELSVLVNQMVIAYCDCVQKHAHEDYSPLVCRALNYIHLNTDSALSLRSLALACNANPSYLSKLFRTETGRTVTEYINHHRIELSIPLLRFTRMGIAQISEKVGFLDENYYARIFKRLKGVSPKAYRQQNPF